MRALKARTQTQVPTSTEPANADADRDLKGRFVRGAHAHGAARLQLVAVPVEQVAAFARGPLERAQQRYVAIKSSRRSGGWRSVDGLVRQACMAELAHDVAAEAALQAPDRAEFHKLTLQAQAHGRQALALWKLLGIPMAKRKAAASVQEPEPEPEPEDPLAKLAREMDQERRRTGHASEDAAEDRDGLEGDDE